MAKNAQVKTLEANEYVGDLAHLNRGFHATSINLSRDSRDPRDLWTTWMILGLGVFLWSGVCPEYRLEQFQFITGGDLATWQKKRGKEGTTKIEDRFVNLTIQRAAGISMDVYYVLKNGFVKCVA